MTRNQLIKRLCAAEGLKSQVKVGDMREIIKLITNDAELLNAIFVLGNEVSYKKAMKLRSKGKK